MKHISIVGSTGSIGISTLDVVRQHPDKFKVVGLAANTSVENLVKQIHEFKPEIVSVGSKELADQLTFQIPEKTKVLYGETGLIEVASYEGAEIVVSAVVGFAGVLPNLEAAKAGKDIVLANKESLVAAGHILTKVAKEYGSTLIPVDSEHSAIFQCLNGETGNEVHRLIITASGGAFREKNREQMESLPASEALKHPNWAMGAKLTIDSATLLNKGFEVIEAHWLFDIPYEKIDVLIHKESIIHSMVEFIDGSIMAQLGVADMRNPISYALEYPKRLQNNIERLDFKKIASLHFEQPDYTRFPCLKMAIEAGAVGGSTPTILNAANEVANLLYREGKIGFLVIEKIIYETLAAHTRISSPSIEEIIELNEWARKFAFKKAEVFYG